jgi:hypothetical protein
MNGYKVNKKNRLKTYFYISIRKVKRLESSSEHAKGPKFQKLACPLALSLPINLKTHKMDTSHITDLLDLCFHLLGVRLVLPILRLSLQCLQQAFQHHLEHNALLQRCVVDPKLA